MALRGDDRSRAVWCRDGLQRLGCHRAEGERKSVSLRAQARRLGSHRILRDVAGDAVQLPTTEEPSHRLRIVVSLHARFTRRVCFQPDKRRAPVAEVSGLLNAAIGDFKTRSDHFPRLLSREACRRRRRLLANIRSVRSRYRFARSTDRART